MVITPEALGYGYGGAPGGRLTIHHLRSARYEMGMCHPVTPLGPPAFSVHCLFLTLLSLLLSLLDSLLPGTIHHGVAEVSARPKIEGHAPFLWGKQFRFVWGNSLSFRPGCANETRPGQALLDHPHPPASAIAHALPIRGVANSTVVLPQRLLRAKLSRTPPVLL